MQKQQQQMLASLKYILHLSVLIIIILLFVFIFYHHTVFALSRSFPIQTILFANNWQLNPDGSTTKNITDCKERQQNIPFPKVQAVTYYSDGKTLFATLWLSSQFKMLMLIMNLTLVLVLLTSSCYDLSCIVLLHSSIHHLRRLPLCRDWTSTTIPSSTYYKQYIIIAKKEDFVVS